MNEIFLHNSIDHNGIFIIIDSDRWSFINILLSLCCKTKLNYCFMYISVLFDDKKSLLTLLFLYFICFIFVICWIDCRDDSAKLHLEEKRSNEGRSSIIQAQVQSKATTKVKKWEVCSHISSSIIAALRPVRLGWVAFAKHQKTCVGVSRSYPFVSIGLIVGKIREGISKKGE